MHRETEKKLVFDHFSQFDGTERLNNLFCMFVLDLLGLEKPE